MNINPSIRRLMAACAAAGLALLVHAADAPRDGAHDFDFNIGTWKTHIRRNMTPLTGRTELVELDGTVHVRPVWNGKAMLEEIEADGPRGHWQAMTLFLYNPQARQWSMSFANSSSAKLDVPMIGSRREGRVELYQQDTVDGRAILVRGSWSDITPTSHTYEEDYSADGGKTWDRAFTAHLTKHATANAPSPSDINHDFDFAIGAWKTHSSRLLRPLTGSREWVELNGVTTVTPVWGGRANLAEYKADGPGNSVELLALRLYDPNSRQWNLNFATSARGTLAVPAYGEFRNGRVDFYDQEPLAGRMILVRFSLWPVDRDTSRSEQAFSADGGQTWEVNWITEYKRMPDASASR